MNKLLSTLFITSLILSACTSPGKRTAIGAGAGAAGGAILGAVIGHQSGNRTQGAVIGALAGAALGGAVGNSLDKQAKELAKIAETRRTDNGIITKLKGDILFDTNSADLKGSAVNNVDQIAAIIAKYPEDIVTVVGHTDSSGNDNYNMSLSEKRAQAVLNRMNNSGVPRHSLNVVAKGETQPVADNGTALGRSQNRRVELHITVDPEKVKKK